MKPAVVTTALLAIGIIAMVKVPSMAPSSAGPRSFDGVVSRRSTAEPGARPHGTDAVDDAALTAVVQRYCQTCHNDQLLTGNLSLQGFDVAQAPSDAAKVEKVIVKLRAGMMPPPGAPRPAGDTLQVLVETLEGSIDRAAARSPNPGGRRFQRLNQAEYERAVYDLIGLRVNASDWLPLDTYLANFDNMAAVQGLSATLLDAYLKAASDISRLALGDRNPQPATTTYNTPEEVSQHPWNWVEGTPFGTRGGMVVTHTFPADGEYVFSVQTVAGKGSRFEDLDISVDGERAALLGIEHIENSTEVGNASASGSSIDWSDVVAVNPTDEAAYLHPTPQGLPITSERVFVRAGQHAVSASFVRKSEGPYDDLLSPHDWSLVGGKLTDVWATYGVTSLPHLSQLIITGPYDAKGVSETASRQAIFTCHPTSPAAERPCAASILTRLAEKAYRRPVTEEDMVGLMSLYDDGAAQEGFEVGVRTALQGILANPFFVFRFEAEPAGVRPGESYRLSDLDLASRLSFFLWGTLPDEELVRVAAEGDLSSPRDLERQVRRMLADPRSETLATRFASQWLRLQDLSKVRPEPYYYPDYDASLAAAMRRETEVFFDHLVRDDRSLLELFTADYTFVNERLAEHYGIPNVRGLGFQRVAYPDQTRRGILGHGSVLVLTSFASRTSPVLRGKWVMEVLLGTPPPPPPPGVPSLDETAASRNGRALTTRERMELHRASPVCRSCHQYMDPIGLALDNFDVTGTWRTRENGMPLDTRGTFYDGTAVSSPAELSAVLMKRQVPMVRNFTENLMAYALGRRMEYYDKPTIRAIVEAAEQNDYRMSSFILGVVQSDAFRMKRAEVVEASGASAR